MTGMPGTDALRRYLRDTGWSDTGLGWRGGEIWSRDRTDVLLPADDVRDLPARLRDLVRTVAAVEGRPVSELLHGLSRPSVDEITVHRAGTMSVPVGAAVLDGLRVLVRESARAVVEGPHLRFPGREPQRITSLLDDVGLDPAPLGRPGFTLAFDAGSGLRAVSQQVHDAVTALGSAAADPRHDLGHVALRGVSLECATALARVAGDDDPGFALLFGWAPGIGAPTPGAPGRVDFAAGAGAVLHSARRRLARSGVQGAATALGVVDGLHDEPGSEDRRRARLNGVVVPDRGGGRGRVVWLRLPDQPSYDRIVGHYHQARQVRVHGELGARDGRIELLVDEDGIRTWDEGEDRRERDRAEPARTGGAARAAGGGA